MARQSIVPLVVSAALVGLIGGCLIVSHLESPINPALLRRAPRSAAKQSFLASRAAVRATEKPYTWHGILCRLLEPPQPTAYHFRREVYEEGRGQAGASLFLGRALEDEAAGEASPAAEAPASPAEAPAGAAGRIDPEGSGASEPDVWSPDDESDDLTRTDLDEILTTILPLLIFFCILYAIVEITAMFARRGRDWMMQTGQWKANDAAFRAQIAKESQNGLFRPLLDGLCIFAMFWTVVSAIDLYGKCYWNWECFFDLDCNLRILTPAVAECAAEVLFPSAILTALIVFVILAVIWCFTRPYAAAFLAALALLGVISLSSQNPFVVLLWSVGAVAAVWFYFSVLPFLPEDVPFWCEDLGSLAASSDPLTRELRDGDAAQRWRSVDAAAPTPTLEETSHFKLVERITWALSDFLARHGRGWRMLWNGVVMRGLVNLCVGRRIRVHGAEHVAHLASHDCVLLAANHRTFFDFFVVSACGIWPWSGASLFSLYPVRATFFYSDLRGALINLVFSACAMFPPILNTPSDEARGEEREGGRAWNDYALRRAAAELRVPGTVVGFHPEGTRNQDPNPCAMTRTKNGVGRLALEAAHAHVVPVFVMGLGGDVWQEIRWNFESGAADAHPIDIVFGPHIDLSDLRREAEQAGDKKEVYAAAGRRVAQAILDLAQAHAARTGAAAGAAAGAAGEARPYQQSA